MGHLEDVDLAGTTRGLGNLRYRLPEERVEHTALADVGAPEEGDLRQVRLKRQAAPRPSPTRRPPTTRTTASAAGAAAVSGGGGEGGGGEVKEKQEEKEEEEVNK